MEGNSKKIQTFWRFGELGGGRARPHGGKGEKGAGFRGKVWYNTHTT
jgi:hypothetical protein